MPLKLYRRDGGKIWHYSGTVAGRRLRGSTRTETKATAQRIIAELEAQQWKGHLDGPSSVLTFARASMIYREAGKPTRFLDKIETYWRETLVKDITSGAVRQAAISICPTASGATRNRHVIVPTQAIINHAAELELCTHLKVKRFPVETKAKEPATWEWVKAFMAHANEHLGALCCFMFLTGARISEALDLRWSDVDLGDAKARIRQTKIGDERIAHLPPALVVAIANIKSNREPSAKVFQYSSRHTAKAQWLKPPKRANIKLLTFHACRHGFATALLHKGVDPITVAKLGGWKTPEHVFRTYGHAQDDETLANLISDTPVARKADFGENASKINSLKGG